MRRVETGTLALLLAAFAVLACERKRDVEHGEPGDAASRRRPAGGEAAKGAVPKSVHADGAPLGEEHEHEELPRHLEPSKKAVADAHIRTGPVQRERLAITLGLPGEIAADPDRSARISSAVAGRIVAVRFREGERVRKGQSLLSVQIPDLGKLRAAHSATLAKAKAVRANADRLAPLVAKGLASSQELQTARAEADALEAEARGLGEQVAILGAGSDHAGRLEIRAPLGGHVLERSAIVGQPVTSEQVLGTIADLSAVWFVGRVFEKDLSRVRVGARAEVILNAHPEASFVGHVDTIGRQVDPVARTVTARIRLENREDLLRVGLFGTARIEVGVSSKETLVVPRAAVTEIGGRPVVFVRHGAAFEVHGVVLGESVVGKVEVLSGLDAGEDVVIDGVFALKSMILRQTLDEDHD